MIFDPVSWRDVILTGHGHVVTLHVASDYLAVDGVRRPLSAGDAQAAVDALGAMLPTPAIVDAIWLAADVRLEPLPHGPPYDASMMSEARWIEHDRLVDAQLAGRGGLIAGHKKDVVLSNRMLEHPEARGPLIFGWHRANGVPIQPLSAAHRLDAGYRDYAHGARPIRLDCLVDGAARDLRDVLRDPALASLVSGEGPLRVLRYEANGSAAPNTSPAPTLPVLRRGDSGEAVRQWQETLCRLGWTVTVDSRFGPATDGSTRAFQRAAGLTADGIVGIRSRAAAATFGGKEPTTVRTSPAKVSPAIPFVQAARYTRVSDIRQIDLVVLHTMESSEKPDTAEGVARWFAGSTSPEASAHYCVDSDSVVQCVRENDVAWGAPGANRIGVQVELAGRASQTAADWADVYSSALLARAAGLVADVCRRHAIPATFVDAAGLLRGERGVTTHAEVSKAWKRSTHWDVGPGFPMAAFLRAVAG